MTSVILLTLAPGLGLEPRLPDPESGVLPLDDPGILSAGQAPLGAILLCQKQSVKPISLDEGLTD